MATICTTNDFETDDEGRLQVRVCGDPDEVNKEQCPVFGGGLNDEPPNALHRDGECGLWVEPAAAKEYRINTPTFQIGAPGLLATGQCANHQFQYEVTNPSTCCDAVVTIFQTTNFTLNIDAGVAVTIGSAATRIAAQTPTTKAYIENEVGPNIDGADYATQDPVVIRLTPGQTQILYAKSRVCARRTTGAARVRFVDVRYDLFGTVVVDQC